jgi:hypothetical protein
MAVHELDGNSADRLATPGIPRLICRAKRLQLVRRTHCQAVPYALAKKDTSPTLMGPAVNVANTWLAPEPPHLIAKSSSSPDHKALASDGRAAVVVDLPNGPTVERSTILRRALSNKSAASSQE